VGPVGLCVDLAGAVDDPVTVLVPAVVATAGRAGHATVGEAGRSGPGEGGGR